MLHVDVGDDVGVKEVGHDIHLLHFEIIVKGESKKNTESGKSHIRGKHGGKIKVLHITASDKTSLTFSNGSKTVALSFELPRASNDAHWSNKRDNKVPCAFGSEEGKLFFGGKEPVGLFRTFHSLFIWARLNNGHAISR